jgi:ATP-dependent RNA helicase DeaD
VHRIGRTGSAGRKGCAILFVAPREMRMLRAIERATRQQIERVQLPTSELITNKRISQFKEKVLETIESDDLDFFHDIIDQIKHEHEISVEQIAAALAKQVQTERPLRMKELPRARQESPRHQGERARKESPRDFREKPSKATRRRDTHSETDMVTYRIEVGRDDGVMPKNIVGAIANEIGLDFSSIGHIKLYDDHSTVDLPKDLSRANFQHLIKVRVCHKPLNISLADGSAFSEEPAQKKTRPRLKVGEDRPVPKKKTERKKEKWSSARKKEAAKKRAKKAKEKSKEKKKTKK